MTTLRRIAYAVFGVACTHLVFGAIVRISGSGMGCGPHWPRCYGRWFPPMDRPDLVIEVTHRYLASILLLSLIGLTVAAFRRRAEPGVGGPGGVLRMAGLATVLGFSAAILGAVTVKLGNSAPATVAHWTVAMSLVAAVTATVIRAGGLGGDAARRAVASAKTRRSTFAAAALALTAVVMGGLTAKVQGGPIACLAFPLCGANPAVPRGAVHVQSTHRVIAVLLVLHLVGLFFALRKRQEASVIRRAASIALGLGILQLLIAGAMIGMRLPPVLRSMHEATGVSIWIATFVLAYLARRAGGEEGTRGASNLTPTLTPPEGPLTVEPRAASVRATPTGRPVLSSAVRTATPSSASTAVSRVETTPVATTVTAAPRVPMAYFPPVVTPPSGLPTAIAAPESLPLPEAPTRRLADEPIELPAAYERASRLAADAALAFHRGAVAALLAASLEGEAIVATPPVPMVSEISVVAEADVDVVLMEASAVSAADEVAAPVVTEADVAMATAELAVTAVEPAASVAQAAAASETRLEMARLAPPDGEVTSTVPVAEDRFDAAVVAEAAHPAEAEVARGAEAMQSVGAEVAHVAEAAISAPDPIRLADAPVSEPDPIVAVIEAPEVDDLYNLRELQAAEEDDDDRSWQDDAEDVLSLDEEFSRRALAMELEAEEPVSVAPAVVSRASFTTLTAISALRRPAMTHSVAVIVARGAEF